MITRRGFLKLLSALPGVAALPATAEVLNKVAAEEDVVPPDEDRYVVVGKEDVASELRGGGSWWLRLNGKAIQAKALSLYREQPWLRFDNLYAGKVSAHPGLPQEWMELEMYGAHPELHTATVLGDTVLLEYSPFDEMKYVANVVVSNFDVLYDGFGEGCITSRVTLLVRDGRWEGL